jgi:DNA polymerase V
MLVDLRPQGQGQEELDLFSGSDEDAAPSPRRPPAALMGALDALNQRFGRDAVSVASAVRRDAHAGHAAKQERRSPRYTTRLDEIVVVRA